MCWLALWGSWGGAEHPSFLVWASQTDLQQGLGQGLFLAPCMSQV